MGIYNIKNKINQLFKILLLNSTLLIIKIGIITKFRYLSILGFIFYLILNSNRNYFIYLFKILINKNKPYFILLQKEGFNKDAEIIKNNIKNIESINFSRTFVKGIARCYLSKDICDNNYFSASTINNKSKQNLYNFYNFLFSKIPTRLKPIAIFTGNFGYFPEQELFKAAHKNKIKGIAIHKECLKSDGLYDLWKYIYSVRRDIFGGSLSLVYNNIEAELQQVSGVVDTKKTKILVIGCPRVDQAHNLRKSKNQIKKHQVLMFGFGTKTSLPLIPRKSYGQKEPHHEYLNREDKNLRWFNLLEDLCNSFYSCAENNPKIEFILKLKPLYRENHEMISFFEHKKLLKNIKIVTSGNAISLLEKSTIVISHRSTALFEGIARGIPVLIPNLGESNLKKYRPYIFNFSNIDDDVITIKSKEEFESSIQKLLDKKPSIKTILSKNKKDLLKRWVGNDDGKSSERLISILKKEFY